MKTVMTAAVAVLMGGQLMAAGNKNWEFKASEVSVIEVETDAGEIILVPAEGPSVTAEITGEYDPEKCEAVAGVTGGTLAVSVKGKRRWFLGRNNCEAGVKLSAPAGLSLEIKTAAGRVKVGAFISGARISSGAGGIELAALSGPVNIYAGAGAITGELFSEELRLASGAGKIDLVWTGVPSRGSAFIKSGAGSVSLAFPGNSRIKMSHLSGAGGFDSEIGSDPSAPFHLDIKTGAGSVRIAKKSQ